MDIYQTRNMNDDAVTGVLLVYSICCFYYILFVCFIYLFRFLDQFIVFQFSSATSIRLQILGLSIQILRSYMACSVDFYMQVMIKQNRPNLFRRQNQLQPPASDFFSLIRHQTSPTLHRHIWQQTDRERETKAKGFLKLQRGSYRSLKPRTRLFFGLGLMGYAAFGMWASPKLEKSLGMTPSKEEQAELDRKLSINVSTVDK
ncbi:conserved hypothetical protein [Microsporum canis CBS 113480]|uniref:Uncharacterized protein n=1 Tax=Arthroderma otae (strain ATCC MYA-4605 / CBS 113480) TaxID=554155 RepID=C5FNN8_ARTOC|nr:conserved hypothetical protein [Microsporum canis CBS 113480]EEQ31741.1 conserved hypothetical protein [Microsporum canis CBS 113480]